MKKKEKKNVSLKKMKLVTKTSLTIGITLTLALALLISISIIQAKGAIETSINGEFSKLSTGNAALIQTTIDDAKGVVDDLTGYLQHQYDVYDSLTDEEKSVTKQSEIYPQDIAEIAYNVEHYILNNAWSAVENNTDIVGFGAFYEPFAFDSDVKDYSIYINNTDAQNKDAKSYGKYSEYSQLNFYQTVKATKATYITAPYKHDGFRVSTIAFPILHNDEVQGVIAININVDNFSKIKSAETEEKFPTMFVNIVTQDMLIVYDTESADDIGKNTSEFNSPEVMKRLYEKCSNGVPFTMETLRKDGSTVVRYYTPIDCGTQTWWTQTALQKSDLYKDVYSLVFMMIAIAAAVLFIIIAITIFILRKYLKPIDNIVSAATNISNGKLDIDLDIKTEDEIGILSKTFIDMSDNLKTIIGDISYLLGEITTGKIGRAHV